MILKLASRTVFVLLISLLLTESAWAQPRTGGRVQARVVVQEGAIPPGGEGMVGVVLEMQRGWKVQAGKGSGDEMPPYLATTIEMTVPRGWTAGAPMWPAAGSFMLGDEQLKGYDGTIVVVVPVRVPADEPPGQLHAVQATVQYQACDATFCEMPVTIQALGDVRVAAPGDTGPALDEPTARLFREAIARNAGGSAPPGAAGGMPLFAPSPVGPGPTPAAAIQQERREQSWFISYWYLWVIVLVAVIAGGVVLWRVLR